MPNWVDWVIIAVICYAVYDGWQRGFTSMLANMGSFLISLWLAIRFHVPVGNFFTEKFGAPASWTNVLGYIAVAFVSQILIESVLSYGVDKLPEKLSESKANHWLGSLLSAGNALLVIAFFLLLALSLPLRGSIKQDVRQSVIGSRLVVLSDRYGGNMESSLEEISREALRFLTVEPGSNERIPLDIPQKNPRFAVREDLEREMVALVNKERVRLNIPELRPDSAITAVARGKSMDMFEQRYFSHYDPAGKNAADRMNGAGIKFTFVGENLAYAPDVASAHSGLMASEGHRKNILEPRFHRIGIGVVDGGIYGFMFTQIFAD